MTVLWLRFLNELKHGECDISADLMNDKYISKAISLCEEGAFSQEELVAYEYYWDIIRTEKSVHDDAKQEGMAKGIAKGREEGLAEGIEKGREEGKAESLEKIVVNSFKNGCSIDFISSIIDLSNDEIMSILQKNRFFSLSKS
jgi:flagellar biosynthesis/type III secretory pathway protein FliH